MPRLKSPPPWKNCTGLAEQEAREGIAHGKWSEHEEAVGGDAEEHVDLLAVEVRAEFQVVPAARQSRANSSPDSRSDRCSADR